MPQWTGSQKPSTAWHAAAQQRGHQVSAIIKPSAISNSVKCQASTGMCPPSCRIPAWSMQAHHSSPRARPGDSMALHSPQDHTRCCSRLDDLRGHILRRPTHRAHGICTLLGKPEVRYFEHHNSAGDASSRFSSFRSRCTTFLSVWQRTPTEKGRRERGYPQQSAVHLSRPLEGGLHTHQHTPYACLQPVMLHRQAHHSEGQYVVDPSLVRVLTCCAGTLPFRSCTKARRASLSL